MTNSKKSGEYTHSAMYHSVSMKPHRIRLRETKRFWITDGGLKFKKSSGVSPCDKWSRIYIDLETLREWAWNDQQ